jgi:glycolate oxidase
MTAKGPDREAVIAELRRMLGDAAVLTEAHELARYEQGWRYGQGKALAAVRPSSTEETARVLAFASQQGIRVVPQGANTGLVGASTPDASGEMLVLSLERLSRTLEIDPVDRTVVAGGGVLLSQLDAALAGKGLMFAIDLGADPTVGGMIATNAAGTRVLRHGDMRQNVLGLEVVLADGSVIRTGSRTVKDVAGYALTQLFVGSQGTLGIVTEATLRLRPAPPPRSTLLAFFPSLAAAGSAVADIVRSGASPVTLEFMDAPTIAAVDDWQQLGLDREAAAMLMIESDLPASAAAEELATVERICADAGATSTVRAADAQEADWLRQARRMALRALERYGVVHMEDVGVPRARVMDLLLAIDEAARRHGVETATFGHAGDGNLHPNFVFRRDASGDVPAGSEEALEAVQSDIYAAAIALGGTVTAEHGIGTTRREWLVRQRGEAVVGVMRTIKAALDPAGILNPGKVV